MNIISRIKNIIHKSDLQDVEKLRELGVEIGKECEIYKKVSFGSEPYLVKIGNHVRITKGCQFITHDGGVWVVREMKSMPDIDLFGKINIGNNVHIGMNTIIMPGVTISDNCIIGCGAVVTKDIPSGEIWGGVPAKKIKDIDEYIDGHMSDFVHTKYLSPQEKRIFLSKENRE